MNKKIVSLTELAAIIKESKKQGKTVAQCHGCFDLLHIGHIKHFESAKKTADQLVVTLTPDRFVNKGPGRPAFNEHLRLEAIAALEAVDYVALNDWPTAVETISLLKPDFYVKGPDYKIRENDITDNIGKEEDAIIKAGGKLYITDDEAYSSSKLINAHLSPLDDFVQEYLSQLKKKFSAADIIKEIDKLVNTKVLVIGDTIIDEYHYCSPLGKSSKSPTISTIFRTGQTFAGGVLAIANHVKQFAGEVELVTLLGKENSFLESIEKKLSEGIKRKFFYRSDGPTNTKRRYLDTYLNIKLFEVTFMNDKYITEELEKEIISYLQNTVKDYDMILLADFGHGFITPGIIKFLEQTGKFLAINAQTNSNNYGFNYITKYIKASYISIDEKELRLPFGDNYGKLHDLIKQLAAITHCDEIQITLGQHGALYYKKGEFFEAPAFANAVKDSVGAGDAVLSVTSLCAYNNVPVEMIPFIGNCTGALAVQIIGNEHPVFKKDLTKFISHFIK